MPPCLTPLDAEKGITGQKFAQASYRLIKQKRWIKHREEKSVFVAMGILCSPYLRRKQVS